MNLNKQYSKRKQIEDNLDDGFDDDDSLDDNSFDDDGKFDSFGDNMGINPMDKHNDLLKELTNFEPFLKRLKSQFLGMTWSQKEERYIRNPNIKPLMNEVGAEWCINYLAVFARDNNILSSLMENHFRGIMQDAIRIIGTNITTRCEEFGISKETDLGDCAKILHMMHSAILLILSGAGKTDNYMKFLGTAVTRNENISLNNNPINQQQPKGFMDKGFNWIRGR